MQLQKTDIKKLLKILTETGVHVYTRKATPAFPLERAQTKEIDGLSFEIKNTTEGIRKEAIPVLLYNSDSEGSPTITYIDDSYVKKFDIIEYIELAGGKLKSKDKEFLQSLDCILVMEDYIFFHS